MEFALLSRHVVTPNGVQDAAVLVRDGSIEAIAPRGEIPAGRTVIDVGEKAVLPALVDSHVHINDPGRVDWEGFETATQAAAAGGVTALMEMPLNSIPVTTTVDAFQAKLDAAAGRLWVDCGFWGGVVPGNAGQLEPMIDMGAAGFKAFLIDSGIAEFPAVGEKDLRAAMPILAKRGVPLLVHAELDCGAEAAGPEPGRYANYLASRPRAWENGAVELMIRLCRETGCRVHIVHLSSSDALEALRKAKAEGLPITAETCPHYLCLCAEQIEDGRTEFKCAPPIREKENQDRLWEALREGTLDFVVSDHSPCAPQLKLRESGDFVKAWGGISSVQFGLSAIWTEGRRRGISLEDAARWMSAGPARFAGLKGKGGIIPGNDADFLIFDPQARFTVAPNSILHKHKLTPYNGRELLGKVETTFLRGKKIYDNGKIAGPFGVARSGLG